MNIRDNTIEERDQRRAVAAISARIMSLPAEQVSEWFEAHGRDQFSKFPLDIWSCPSWTEEHREAVRVALYERTMSFSDPFDAIKMLGSIDTLFVIMASWRCAGTIVEMATNNSIQWHESPRGATWQDAAKAVEDTRIEMFYRLRNGGGSDDTSLAQRQLRHSSLAHPIAHDSPVPNAVLESLARMLMGVDKKHKIRRLEHVTWLGEETTGTRMVRTLSHANLMHRNDRLGVYGTGGGIAAAKSAIADSIVLGIEACSVFYDLKQNRTDRDAR